MNATNLIMQRGKTLAFNVTCTSGGAALDLTGLTLKFMAKRSVSDADADAVITKTTPTGIVVTTPTSGVAQVQVLAADTASLANAELVLAWALQVTSAANPYVVAGGLLTIEPSVIVASS